MNLVSLYWFRLRLKIFFYKNLKYVYVSSRFFLNKFQQKDNIKNYNKISDSYAHQFNTEVETDVY